MKIRRHYNKMKIGLSIVGTITVASSSLAASGEAPKLASSAPQEVLKQLVEHDAEGNPAARIQYASANAMANYGNSVSNRIAFDMDADPVALVSSWRFPSSGMGCESTKVCELQVVYRVEAVTVGDGIPSWMDKKGREIRLLNSPIEKTVRYKFERVRGEWKVRSFPLPHVSLCAIRASLERKTFIPKVDPAYISDQRVIRHQEVVSEWRQRQLNVLGKVVCAEIE